MKTTTRKIPEVVGIDLGATSTKLVRVRTSGSGFSLVDADVLPALDRTAPPTALPLDKKHQIAYSAACYSARGAMVRFVDMPARHADDRSTENRLRKQIGVGPEFRLGYAVTRKPARPDADVKILAVALPNEDAKWVQEVLPYSRPSLISLEVSSLAALHSFEKSPAALADPDHLVCYIDAGSEVTTVNFLNNGDLVLARKFEYGGRDLNQRIMELLNVDEEGALNVLYDDPASLDAAAEAPMSSFLRQVAISRQFVERGEGKVLKKVYTSGGLSYSAYWLGQIQGTLETEIAIWNPFTGNGMSNYPRGVQGVESMFAPAVGCALAVLRGASV